MELIGVVYWWIWSFEVVRWGCVLVELLLVRSLPEMWSCWSCCECCCYGEVTGGDVALLLLL